MKYILDKLNHCNFKSYECGRLAPRAYCIPHTKLKSAKAVDYKSERYNSDMVTILSGEWEFKYYKKKLGYLPERRINDESKNQTTLNGETTYVKRKIQNFY